jgi:hypothetical protein
MDIERQRQYLENKEYLLNLNDEELIANIIEDSDHIAIIFENYFKDFSKQLTRKFKYLDKQIIEDIVLDSIIDLKDKILKSGQELLNNNGSLEKYLFGSCTNNIKSEINRRTTNYSKVDIENLNYFFDPFQDIQTNQDDLDEIAIKKMIRSLKKIKDLGGKCYSLIILSLDEDYNYSDSHLTKLFNYQNDVTTRNQKHKCIKRLKRINLTIQLS